MTNDHDENEAAEAQAHRELCMDIMRDCARVSIRGGYSGYKHSMLSYEFITEPKRGERDGCIVHVKMEELELVFTDSRMSVEKRLEIHEMCKELNPCEHACNIWVAAGAHDIVGYDEVKDLPEFGGVPIEIIQAILDNRMDIIWVRDDALATGSPLPSRGNRQRFVERPIEIRLDARILRRQVVERRTVFDQKGGQWFPLGNIERMTFAGITGLTTDDGEKNYSYALKGLITGRMPNPNYTAPEHKGSGPRPLTRVDDFNFKGPRGYVVVMSNNVIDRWHNSVLKFGVFFDGLQSAPEQVALPETAVGDKEKPVETEANEPSSQPTLTASLGELAGAVTSEPN
ncbi:MAG: hypothetical protein WA001_04715 [Patescibacteria group bacterium]